MAGVTEGLIRKGVGGLYTVETPQGMAECRARGIFRLQKRSPLAGDWVEVVCDGEGGAPVIDEIRPRRNALSRPPIANIDKLFLVVSMREPSPNLAVADKLIAIAEKKEIEPVILINKADLGEAGELCGIYRDAGFSAFAVSGKTGQGMEQVRRELAGCVSAFTGNSGVGKSSILNALGLGLCLDTGEISRKLGRGRHTTRTVELHKLDGGGYVADTPGFSALEVSRNEVILKDELALYFREFAPHRDQCRFTGCSHTAEKGCAVREALEKGLISPSRYESYLQIYEGVKNIKEWELNT